MLDRVVELTVTADDVIPFAVELDRGATAFRRIEQRRQDLRAELDGAFMHLYDLDREETVHILNSFGIVQRREQIRFGEFRTKRLTLERYDAMAEAIRTGDSYQTILDPPPGDGPRNPARMDAKAEGHGHA
jgi:hypothetical protein